MRIAEIGKYYPPVVGGMETALQAIARGLSAAGHSVTVFCSSVDHREKRYLDQSNVEVVERPTYGKLFSVPLTHWRSQDFQEFDLLHVHLPNPLALAAACRSGRPFVATVHADATSYPLLSAAYRAQTGRLLSEAKAVIVTSNSMREYLSSLGFKWANSATVIPFGLDESLLAMHGESFSSVDLTIVGRLVPYKGVSVLLRALSEVCVRRPQTRLRIVGRGPEGRRLRELAKNLRVENAVEWAGELRGAKLAAAYRATEILVLPSIHEAEAFGLSLVEGLMFGKPLITTSLKSGVSEVNLEGVTGRSVMPRDVNGLAGAILDLIDSPSTKDRFGLNARAHFEANFRLAKMVERHVDLFAQVKGRPKVESRTRAGTEFEVNRSPEIAD